MKTFLSLRVLAIVNKEEFLDLLEKDKEFRYAVAGKLGILELLRRMDAVERELKRQRKVLITLVKEVRDLKVAVGSLGRRLGVDVRALVDELLKRLGVGEYVVEKFRFEDREGRYGPRGVVYEVDLYVSNDKTFLVELKSLVEPEDVDRFYLVADAVERILGRRAEGKIIVGVHAAREALERAEKLGVTLLYGDLV
ncbi:hypothetical protein Pcal_1516 [Pyrobaculum calidifontis JCM 11548]|uniref:DUF3782 domain-containing protein n=1 Tax=Pyrobaculum calidifontis (strain DSM 21063 / JCM 11548 / VA1) TaxID=410359 RepID=A3MWB8_PYRCJ|nr:hypothetical protein Pcal_1516 [Pyrobaculum calidifontis JCM 11548]